MIRKEYFFNQDIHPNDMEFDIRLVGDRFQNGIPQDYYIEIFVKFCIIS